MAVGLPVLLNVPEPPLQIPTPVAARVTGAVPQVDLSRPGVGCRRCIHHHKHHVSSVLTGTAGHCPVQRHHVADFGRGGSATVGLVLLLNESRPPLQIPVPIALRVTGAVPQVILSTPASALTAALVVIVTIIGRSHPNRAGLPLPSKSGLLPFRFPKQQAYESPWDC